MVVVMVVVMIVIMVIVVMVVIMVMIVAFEEVGIERENTLEVEGATVEDAVERDGAALGPVDDGVRIDGADAPLDLGELVLADEIGLVEKDHVGKADLVFGLGR